MQSTRQAKLNTQSWTSRLAWIVLVVLIPVIVTVLMIGVALQLVGLPVWQTSTNLLGLSHKPSPIITGPTPAQLLLQEKHKNSVLRTQEMALKRRIANEQQLEQGLRDKIASLQTKLDARVNTRTQAKQEATVLLAMDPDQAAQVLSKMQVSQAASVVAAMSPSDAGPILSQVDPNLAGRILSQAAQIPAQDAAQLKSNGG